MSAKANIRATPVLRRRTNGFIRRVFVLRMVSFQGYPGFIARVPDARVELMVMICLPHVTKAVRSAGFRKRFIPESSLSTGSSGGMRIPARRETPSDEVGWVRRSLAALPADVKFRLLYLGQRCRRCPRRRACYAFCAAIARSTPASRGRYDTIAPICDGTSSRTSSRRLAHAGAKCLDFATTIPNCRNQL